jgi:hypothetical protein
MTDKPITDPAEAARYVQSARDLYGTDSALEIAEPPVVVKTASGAASWRGFRSRMRI